jgi:TP901 family phage tail tape measure protein
MPASIRDVLLLIRTKEDAQRALSGISREMRRAGATADAATARALAAQARATAAQMRATGATKAQVDSVIASARAYDAQAVAIGKAAERHERMRRVALDVGDAMVALGIATIAGGAAAAYGLKQAIDTAVEYDKQVRLTYTQVDRRFKPSLIELGEIGRRVAREIAVPFEEIQPALFDVFSSTEANVKEAEVLLKAFSKAAVAGQTEILTASRATIGIMNAFKVPIKDVNRILDIQFQLVQEGVGTYEEWAQRIGLVTPSAVRAGQSVESMAAALATATRLGISAARAGTAVARAYDAISNPKTIAKLKKLNVQVLDAKGNFRPLVDIMGDWQKQLNKLPPSKRVASILDVLKGAGSTIEARRFLQGILLTKGGLELFQEVMGEFEGDVGAFDRAYSTMADSTAAKSELLRNQWKLLQENIGRALMPTFNKLLDTLSRAFDWFNKLPQSTKNMIAQIALWGTALLLAGGILITLIGSVIIFAGAISGAVGTVLLITGAIAGLGLGLGGLALAIYGAWKKSKEFRGLLSELEIQFGRVKKIISDFAIAVWNDFNTYVLPPLKDLWKIIQTEVLPVLNATVKQFGDELIPKLDEAAKDIQEKITPALQMLGDLLKNDINPAVQDLTKWWNENRTSILKVTAALMEVAKVAAIAGAIIGVSGLAGALGMAKVALASFAGGLKIATFAVEMQVGALKTMYNAISTFIGWIGKAIGKLNEWSSKVRSAVGSAKNAITSALSGAGTMLWNAGRDIIQGLINGIEDKIGALKAKLGAITALIPKSKGPKATDLKLLYKPGQWVMQGLIQGVHSQIIPLQRELHQVSHAVSRTSYGMSTPRFQSGVGFENQQQGALTSVNEPRNDITVNVYTHEIDPRKTAQELGWELQGRLG